jgi:hypothetical protein
MITITDPMPAERSAGLPPAGASTIQLGSFDEDSWDDLLLQIEEGQVLPIVGAELLKVNVGVDRPVSLYHWRPRPWLRALEFRLRNSQSLARLMT